MDLMPQNTLLQNIWSNSTKANEFVIKYLMATHQIINLGISACHYIGIRKNVSVEIKAFLGDSISSLKRECLTSNKVYKKCMSVLTIPEPLPG